MYRKQKQGSYFLALLLILPFTAHGFLFDPDGAGGVPAVDMDSFDVVQSSILNANGVTAIAEGVSAKLKSYSHGNISALIKDGAVAFFPGSGKHECEITIVLGLDTEIVGVDGNKFDSAYDPAGSLNFFEMWFDDTCNADPLAGTGFNDGTLIMSGRFTSLNSFFTVTETANLLPLDGLTTDNWEPVVTVSGNGSANNVRIRVESFDPAFFPGLNSGDIITLSLQNYSQSLPFTTTNPSELYAGAPGGAAPLLAPTIGANTGNNGNAASNGIDGPDFIAQTDVNISVSIEPAPLASLGDRVWEDLDADGIQDCTDDGDGIIGGPGDVGPECGTGIPGVIVTLLGNQDGDADCTSGDEFDVDTAITDGSGFYEFLNLDPNLEYCVLFDQPSAQDQLQCDDNIINPGIGAQFSPANQGNDDAVDSDADTTTGQTGNISLSAGDFDRTWDAGLYCPAKIGDRLIDDLNRDGIQETGEPGIEGVLVELVECVNGAPGPDVIDSQYTDPTGMYMFNPLPPGDYAVIFSKPGDTVFSPMKVGGDDTVDCDTDGNGLTQCVTLGPNEYNPNVDACVNTPPAGLGDFVWEDTNVDGLQNLGEPGIAGVTVNLLSPGDDGECNTPGDLPIATTVTDAGGMYLYDNLDPGRYCVEFELDSLPDDFCATASYPLGAPLFTLHNQGGDDAVDSDADPTTGKTGNIDLGPDEFDPTNDAGIYCPAKIGDRVWEDTNTDGLQDNTEPGVTDVEVQLFECGPDGIAGTDDDVDTGERRFTDNVDGMYMFGAEPGVFDLAPGDYYVRFVQPFGRDFTIPKQGGDDTVDSDCQPDGVSACVALGSRGINLNRDCGIIPPPPPKCDLVIDKTCRVETPPPPAFDKCKGKLQQFSVIWTGADITVSGLPNDAPGGAVSNNQKVTFFGPFSQNDVLVDIAGAVSGQSKFHMSCSDDDFNSPDDCGKPAGNSKNNDSGFINDWQLQGFIDAEDRVLDCGAAGTEPDFPQDNSCTFVPQPANCEVLGKPTSLTFRYTGQGCSASNNPQDGKAQCSGDVNGLLPVTIVAGKKGLRSRDLYTVSPTSVASGEEFTISASKFNGDSEIEISNSGGTEENIYHASCSQPLAVGDKYGSLELVGFNGASGGTDVLYGYTVTNNGDPLSDVSILDDRLGIIAEMLSFATNQTRSFTRSGAISQTTTNVATAIGVLADDGECLATDQVTVVVEEPPAPPMTCRDIKPITALSMVWDGPSGVDIATEGGQQFNDVQRGSQITFSTAGLGNDVDLTLSGAVNGSSRYHVSCSDQEMNGSEDCGNNEGNGKGNDSSLINTWLFDGMTGESGSFACELPNTGVVDPEEGAAAGGDVSGAASLDLGDDKKVKWELTNNGNQDVFITRVEVTWPSQHDKVKKFKLEGDFAKDVNDSNSPTAVPADKAFENDPKKRKLKKGRHKKLEVEFTEKYKDHNQSDYTITVEFDNGQTLSFP